MKTLLEKAKEIPNQPQTNKWGVDEETMELAIAYLKGEVSRNQIMRTLKIKSEYGVFSFIVFNLLEAYRQGKIQVKG